MECKVLLLLREKNSRVKFMELVLAAIVMRKEKNELQYKTHQVIKEKPAEVLIG